ncbi:MAG: hypothetical protein ACFB0A_11945 [Croceivirga sp.]
MKKLCLLLIIVAWSINFCFGQKTIANDVSEAHIAIAGTKISMVPPQAFTVAANFAGFQQDESGASIMVLDLPGPFSEVSKAFTEEGLKSQGMTFVASESLDFQGLDGMLLTVQQEAYGQLFQKHILAFGNDKETVLINGTFPSDKIELHEPVRDALLTTFYDSTKEIDPFGTVDFEISSDGGGLIFAKSMASSLIFNKDGKLPSQSEDQANFIVGKAFSETLVTDKKQFASARLGQLPIEIDSIIATTSVEIDGLPGIEIIADGRNPQNNNEEKVYQVMLFEETLYYIMLGSCEGNFGENIKMFQNMAKTFKRKPLK